MNYLGLCQRVYSECGIPGTISTVVGATNEALLVVNWVRQSLIDIEQARQDWDWMRKDFAFNTVAQQQSYSPEVDVLLADFSTWKNESFRVYLASSGVSAETAIHQYDYDSFRDYYMIGVRRNAYAQPDAIAVAPNRSLLLGLAPDDIYTVNGEYFRTPQELTLDADVPEMPARYHMSIVYGAMVKYGNYQAAPEQLQAGATQYSAILNLMASDQTPMITTGGPLI